MPLSSHSLWTERPVKIVRPLSACHISITQQLTHNATLTQAEKGQNQHNRASLTDSPSYHKAPILHSFFSVKLFALSSCKCPLCASFVKENLFSLEEGRDRRLIPFLVVQNNNLIAKLSHPASIGWIALSSLVCSQSSMPSPLRDTSVPKFGWIFEKLPKGEVFPKIHPNFGTEASLMISYLHSSPPYDVPDHSTHIFSVRIWSWQCVIIIISSCAVVAKMESCFEDLRSKYFQWEKNRPFE